MQEIIDGIQSGDLNNNQILQLLVKYEEKSVTEFNEACDAVEKAEQDKTDLSEELTMAMKVIKDQASAMDSARPKFNKLAGQLKVSQNSISAQELTIKTLRKENKNLREQVKRVKASGASDKKKVERMEKMLRVKNKEAVRKTPIALGQLRTVYNFDNEVLQVYPSYVSCSIGDDDILTDIITLLYTQHNGCFVMVSLHRGEAVFSTFLNPDNTLSDRYIKSFRNNSMSPSKAVRDHATEWLLRVNIHQKTQVKENDLVCYEG